MEGLSGFDRSMMKRLESSALAFYELRQPQQHEERQHGAQTVFTEGGKAMTMTVKRQRRASDASSSSSSSSSSTSLSQVKQFSGNQAQTSNSALAGRLTSDTEVDVSDTGIPKELVASTYGGSNARSPRPTAGPSNATSSCSITFSISRILGHDNTSLATSRRPGSLHHPSVGRTTPPAERTRSQSGMASPDSSCRVAGDDLHHDVKTLDDVDIDDADLNDSDVMTQSPGTAAAAAACGDVLHRLSWLQCTRYKPPKLPS